MLTLGSGIHPVELAEERVICPDWEVFDGAKKIASRQSTFSHVSLTCCKKLHPDAYIVKLVAITMVEEHITARRIPEEAAHRQRLCQILVKGRRRSGDDNVSTIRGGLRVGDLSCRAAIQQRFGNSRGNLGEERH